MKKILLSFCIILLSSLTYYYNAQAKGIAVLDTNKIFEESEVAKKAVKELEAFQAEGVKKLETIEEKRKQAEEKKDEKLLKNIESEMQATAFDLQNKLQSQQEALFSAMTDKFIEVVDNYRKQHNLDLIIQQSEVISYDTKIDITNEIMNEFNKVEIDFKAILSK